MLSKNSAGWLKRLWKGTPIKAPESVQPLVLPGYENNLDELQAHLESNDASVERLVRMAELMQKPALRQKRDGEY
jgi:hypothetical protein